MKAIILLQRILNKYGSNGKIRKYNKQSYDNNGNRITEFEEYNCKYSISTKLKKEETNLALLDNYKNITINFDKNITINKNDKFIDSYNNSYSIEQIYYLGDLQDKRYFYKILCKQD